MDEVTVASCTGYPLYKPGLPETMRWVRCRGCDHEFVDGYFTEDSIQILFSESHPGQTPGDDIETARYVTAKMVEGVASFRPALGGRWLDVGFGNGSLLTTAAEFGFEVTGIDLREDNVRTMRELGVDVHAIEFTQYKPAEPFDVISMADVLEHMPFPKAVLKHASQLLGEGGVLFLSMPNSDSFLWQTLTKNGLNPYFAELEHYHNFGRRRLYKLLEECGFTPRRYGVSVRYRACMEVIAQKVLPNVSDSHANVLPREANTVAVPSPEPPQRQGLAPQGNSARWTGRTENMRLNLGCGRNAIPDWINIDSVALPGVDLVVDMEKATLPFEDNSIAEFHASHFLEHIHNSLPLMQELHRIAKPDALATFRVPYGTSDDADEDPTHVRRYYWRSWGYFSQPHYWRADYGYRGDWDVVEVVLTVVNELKGKSWEETFRAVREKREMVTEMVATLRAIKPARPPLRGLAHDTFLRFVTAE